ncbi:leucine-rich repeat domain-containing protein [Epilithonimonas sp.]|uniref:leucine-rich repeat domain-containing protein n=1 Tax=Epilithonimonas sp. TaxID=2894511 RepID=UPI002897FA8C|nr:leucine-rich repeat domain-containing protein [Epilithonimonas sp.]
MKKIYFLIFIVFTTLACSQDLKFENPDFEKAVLKKYPEIDSNHNGKIDKNEAEKVKELDLMGQNITNANDITLFKNLEYIVLTNNKIEKLKIENLSNLTKFYCARNNLKTLQISNLPKLEELGCGRNQINKVIIKNCPKIESLNLMDNQISDIDLKNFTKLKYLVVDNNKLTSIDLTKNPELIQITINKNHINKVDIRKNINLKMNILYIDENVQIIGNKNQMDSYKKAPTIISN